ncbi:vascular endothelial growth factor A [Chanos chanos]|uniref:Vascular endothelial growth factor A n=1 Tax=Chanos chanos TaxID=29144 RepID=A0A6J2WIV2_CHACN|nr:vascular endothelial growth factor A-like [Chanos chanos]
MPFQEVWRRSFCRTIERLVEVVQEYPGEVEYIYSPACVPLVRCAGCCGDENLECHPTLTSNVTMQLLKIKPAEQDQQYVVMTFVEHKSCECRLRKATVKQERRRSRGRGRKRKERQKMKDCDTPVTKPFSTSMVTVSPLGSGYYETQASGCHGNQIVYLAAEEQF